jgi:hypothetical protein
VTNAVRRLAKNSGLTLSIVGLLALGISATILMFSAFDKVMLRRLPVRDPQQLVRLVQKFPQVGTRSEFPYAIYEAFNRHSKTLSAVFGETQMNVPLTDPGPAAIVRVGLTTPEFFDELGVPALHGRFLTRDDARENSGDVPAVLSHALVVIQVMLCTTLLTGAGVLMRTLANLSSIKPGFDAAQIVSFTVNPGLAGLEGQKADSIREALVERARAIPGVRWAATAGIESCAGHRDSDPASCTLWCGCCAAL